MNSEMVNFLFEIVQNLIWNLAIMSHGINSYHILFILCVVAERFNNWRSAFYLLKSSFILLELLLQIGMVCYKLSIFFISLVFFILSFGLFIGSFSFLQFLVVLLLNFLFIFYKCFIVSDCFIKCLGIETTFNFERETSIGSQFWKSELIDFLVSLNLWNVQIFMFWFCCFAFFGFLSWWLFLLKNFISFTSFVGQDLS